MEDPGEDHPAARVTGSPTLVGATLFVPVSSIEEGTGANPNYSCCSFRGSIVALAASTGKLQLKGYTIAGGEANRSELGFCSGSGADAGPTI